MGSSSANFLRMILIWRGWGVLSALILLVGLAVAVALAQAVGNGPIGAVAFAAVVTAASAGVWFLGVYFNKTRSEQQLDRHLGERNMHYENLIRSGQFQATPGMAAPANYAQARSQADQLLAAERAELTPRFRNNNTLFWIPMQYFAFVGGIAAAVGSVMIAVQ